MISVDDAESFESSQEVLTYLRFAGHDLTADQLARLHRRRLISVPEQRWSSGMVATNYPAGTAERILRILQLRQNTKQLDELAWRLWWEGFKIEPDLVRAYLFRKASRWDEQLSETDDAPPPTPGTDATQGRDVLDDVFFKHLKEVPTNNSLRRQLERGSALFREFAGLFLDDPEMNGASAHRFTDLFASPERSNSHDSLASTLKSGAKELPLELDFNVPFSKVVDALIDDELEPARLVARRVLSSIAAVGHVVQDVFTSPARGRENIGKTLVMMADSPNEQVLALLLTATYWRAHPDDAPMRLTHDAIIDHVPAVTFNDHRRLLYLSRVVPQLSVLLSPDRIRDVFEIDESALAWRDEFYRLQHEYLIELEMATDLASELFDDDPPPGDEDDKILVTSKKKILSDGRRR